MFTELNILATDGLTTCVNGRINESDALSPMGFIVVPDLPVRRYLMSGVLSVGFIIPTNCGWYFRLMSLPRLEDPRLLNRFPAIETRFPGATPEQVEILVTEPIEEAIREVPQVAIIESTSATGLSIVNVELDDSVTSDNQNEIIAQLREKLDSVVLPTQALRQISDRRGGGRCLHAGVRRAGDTALFRHDRDGPLVESDTGPGSSDSGNGIRDANG